MPAVNPVSTKLVALAVGVVSGLQFIPSVERSIAYPVNGYALAFGALHVISI